VFKPDVCLIANIRSQQQKLPVESIHVLQLPLDSVRMCSQQQKLPVESNHELPLRANKL